MEQENESHVGGGLSPAFITPLRALCDDIVAASSQDTVTCVYCASREEAKAILHCIHTIDPKLNLRFYWLENKTWKCSINKVEYEKKRFL